jgi:hypothetical protein
MSNENREALFSIGTKYKTRGKYPRVCTVVDILKTYNCKGELVQIRYVSQHDFAGQVVTDRDVCETTIKMGLISG